jgi:cation:H+ antiporter
MGHDVLTLAIGLIALIVGGELVVNHSVKIARHFRIPTMVIGITIISIGTSLPELAIGIDGMRRGVGDLVLGNMVGTDIVNVLLILGLSALIRPLVVPGGVLRLDLPLMSASSCLLFAFAYNGYLTRWEGLLFVALGIGYMIMVLRASRYRDPVSNLSPDYSEGGYEEPERKNSKKDKPARLDRKQLAITILLMIVGLGAIVFGADYLVRGAVNIASDLGVSDTLIGLTIVAIGTSAPELITTIIATIKNERGLAFGNLIGSSTFNITIVLGTALLFTPNPVFVEPELLRFSMPIMILVGLVCIPVFLTGKRISRLEGGLFVAGYAAYLWYTIAAAV